MVATWSSIKDHPVLSAVVLILIAGGGWEAIDNRSNVEHLDQYLTTKQVQLCIRNARSRQIHVSFSECSRYVERWKKGEPLSGQQHSFLSGWAFGDSDDSDTPLEDPEETRSCPGSLEGPLRTAKTAGIVVAFNPERSGGRPRIEIRPQGADADVLSPSGGDGSALWPVPAGAKWRVLCPEGLTVYWKPLGEPLALGGG